MSVEAEEVGVLSLDTRDLSIHKVELLGPESESKGDLQYKLADEYKELGSKLDISLPSGLKQVRARTLSEGMQLHLLCSWLAESVILQEFTVVWRHLQAEKVTVGIRYQTSSKCSAVQFLNPEQTAGLCETGVPYMHTIQTPV